MALGIVTDELFDAELAKSKPVNGTVVQKHIGRGEGTKELPQALRKVIAEEKVEGTPNGELAKLFGVSESSVSAYGNGATSTATYNKGDKDLTKFVNGVKGKIARKAQNKLKMALDGITPEKLAVAPLKTLSQVAKDMSGIVKDYTVSDNEGEKNAPQIIIYAPQQRNEHYYGQPIVVQE